MKAHINWLLILSALLISCGQIPKNKLEKHFERYVLRKQHVQRIDITDTKKDTVSYFIGYDSLHRIVNNRNCQFYEYDSLGRISKQYQCVLSRDPTCSKPYIFFYEYSNGNLARIKLLNNFVGDSVAHVDETFFMIVKTDLSNTQNPQPTLSRIFI